MKSTSDIGTGLDGELIVDGTNASQTKVIRPNNTVITLGCGPTRASTICNASTPLYLNTAIAPIDGNTHRIYNFTKVTIKNNGVLTHSDGAGLNDTIYEGINILATTQVDIQAGSSIDVTGRGTKTTAAAGGSGGCYGTVGGFGGQVVSFPYTRTQCTTYGSSTDVGYMGSKGANSTLSEILGGNGGGRVQISTDALLVNGSIQANGTGGRHINPGYAANSIAAGGGSGGGIVLGARVATITGYVSAAGGGGGGTGLSYSTGIQGSPGYNGVGGSGGWWNAAYNSIPGGLPGTAGSGADGGSSGLAYGTYPGEAAGSGGVYNPTVNNTGGGGGGAGRIKATIGTINGSYPTHYVYDGNLSASTGWVVEASTPGTLDSNLVTSSTVGATYNYTFTNSTAVVLMASKIQNYGTAEVWVDSGAKTVINEDAGPDVWIPCNMISGSCEAGTGVWATPRSDQVNMFSQSGLDPTSSHTIYVKVLSGKIDIDSFTTANILPAYSYNADIPANVGPYGYYSKIGFLTPGVLGGTNSASLKIGLRKNLGKKVNWKQIQLTGSSVIPAGTTVKVMGRFADTYGSNGFMAPDTKVLDSYSAPINSSTLTLNMGSDIYSSTIELYLELSSPAGIATPIVDGITASYDALEPPTNVNTTLQKNNNSYLKKIDGTIIDTPSGTPAAGHALYGTAGGTTNETTLKVTASGLTCAGCTGTTTGRHLEVQYKAVGTAFDSPTADETTNLFDGSPGDIASVTSTATLTGLSAGTSYQLRTRASDGSGRASAWTYYGSGTNSANEADFTVDQSAPVLGTFTVKGNIGGSPSFVNATEDASLAKVEVQLRDNISTNVDVQFSEDGVNGWGAYYATNGSNNLDNNWGANSYITVSEVTNTLSLKTLSAAWKFTTDGAKQLYIRVRDNAGNIITSGGSNNVTLDSVFPTGTVTINTGAARTNDKNVNLILNPSEQTATATVSGIKEFQLSNDGSNWGTAYNPTTGAYSGAWQAWLPSHASSGYTWSLVKGASDTGTDGARTVYVKYRDNAGNINTASPLPNTVTVGGQTWQDRNLNSGTMVPGGTAQSVGQKWCYDDSESNCTTYGALYQWNTAMAGSTTEGAQGACPVNFHVPSDSEYKTLEMNLGMSQAQADASGWRGTDEGTKIKTGGTSGFEALLGGYAYPFSGSTAYTYFWTSTQASANFAWYRQYVNTLPNSIRDNSSKLSGYSLRCIQNSGFYNSAISASTTLDTTAPAISVAHLESSNSSVSKAKPGDVITLTMVASEAVTTPSVTIAGHAAAVTGSTPNFTATYTMQQADANGTIAFNISSFADLAGNAGVTRTTTTDSSAVAFDKDTPTAPTFDFVEGLYTNSPLGQATLRMSLADTGGSDLVSYQLATEDTTSGWQAASVNVISGSAYTDNSIVWDLSPTEGVNDAYARIIDGAGNVSVVHTSITYDVTNPGNPTAITAQKSISDATVVNQSTWYPHTAPKFSWSATDGTLGSGVKGYWVYLGPLSSGVPVKTVSPDANYFFLPIQPQDNGNAILNINLSAGGYPEGKLYLKTKTEDNVGLLSSGMNSFTYYYDKTVPSVVSGLTASKDVLNKIHVSWNASTQLSSESPLDEYQIERVKAQYTIGNDTFAPQLTDIDWYNSDASSGYAVFDFYRADPVFTAHGFDDDKDNPIQGQTALQTGVRYTYRVRAKDISNAGFGEWQNSGYVFGLTRDTMKPEVIPSGLTVGVCDTGHLEICSNNTSPAFGHEIKVTWLGGSDIGSFMKGYKIYRNKVGSAENWEVVGFVDVSGGGAPALEWYDNDANNADTFTTFKPQASSNVNDYTIYEYRVTGVDNSLDYNENFLGNEVDTYTEENYKRASERTPDVTNPPMPTALSGAALGLDDSDPEAYTALSNGTGQATLAGVDYLVDSAKSWTPDSLVGFQVRIISGTGSDGALKNIASNTSNRINLTDSWDTEPDGSSAYEIYAGHQWVKVRWLQNNDTNLYGGSGSGIVDIRLFRSETLGGTYVDVTDSTDLPVECSLNTWECTQKRLPDLTDFYYKVFVTDAVGNLSPLSTSVGEVTTARSSAPTLPQDVQISHTAGEPTDANKIGHKLHVSFTGSYAKDCQIGNNKYCLEAYEVYRSTTNYSTDMDWLDQAKTTRLPDITLAAGTKEERGYPRSFDDEGQTYLNPTTKPGLSDATRYYYKVRARDNTPVEDVVPGPFYSALSEVDEVSPTGLHKGWDITPDATKPVLKSTNPVTHDVTQGLGVKVRDTHPNRTQLRNIVSWLVVDQSGRKKLPYETCNSFVESGTTYCSDFAKYEIWRQKLDNNTVLENVLVGTTTDIQTNFFTDYLATDLQFNKYNYYVVVVDNSDTLFKYPAPYNTLINTDANRSQKAVCPDSIIPGKATPTIVGNVTLSNIGVASATVTWSTDQDTDAVVEFREKYLRTSDGKVDTANLNSTGAFSVIGANTQPGESSNVQGHTVNLFGLQPLTPYEYRVVSKNYLANPVSKGGSNVPELTTKGFTITYNPSPEDISTVSAEIHWTTNMPSNSNMIEFRESNGTQTGAVAETPMSTQAVAEDAKNCDTNPGSKLCTHSASIEPLKKATEYTINIISVSLDNFTANSGLQKFTTANSDSKQFTIAPSASNVAERNITSTSAQIIFQTSEPTSATLYYDTKTGAPNFDPKDYRQTATDAMKSTTHAILVDGLEPGKKYFYIVKVDNGLLSYTSPEATFTAVLKPKISNLKVADVKPYSFRLTWDTNIDTETLINLGTSATYGEKRGKPGLMKAHDLLVEGLLDNTEYHYQILAKDETGEEVASGDSAVRTPMDTEGPKISAVKVDVLPMGENDTTSSIIVTWQTDKPSTTLVEYDQGLIGGDYNNRSTEDATLNNSHTVIIKNLAPASSYHYRLVSKDKRNNVTTSQDYTFVTPSKEKSILQMILKSLEETFAWTKNLNQFFATIGKRLTGKS